MVATSTEVGNLVTTTAGLVDPLSCCLLVGRMVKVVGSPLVVMSALSASVGGWSRWVPALVLVILILSGMEAFFRRSTIPWQSFTSGPSIAFSFAVVSWVLGSLSPWWQRQPSSVSWRELG